LIKRSLAYCLPKERLKSDLASTRIVAERIRLVESTCQIFAGSDVPEYSVDDYVRDVHQCGPLSHPKIEDMRELAFEQ
jgi:hypothetical protein